MVGFINYLIFMENLRKLLKRLYNFGEIKIYFYIVYDKIDFINRENGVKSSIDKYYGISLNEWILVVNCFKYWSNDIL